MENKPRSRSWPSRTPPSETRRTVPWGSWRTPACRSSSLLSGVKLLLLRLSSESERVWDRGSSKLSTADSVGRGAGTDNEVDGTGGGGGKRETTSGEGSKGGVRACLWDVHYVRRICKRAGCSNEHSGDARQKDPFRRLAVAS